MRGKNGVQTLSLPEGHMTAVNIRAVLGRAGMALVMVALIATEPGCGLTLSPAAVRTACDYMTDAEFADAIGVTQFARDTGLSKTDYVSLADQGCADPAPEISPEQCASCLSAVADAV